MWPGEAEVVQTCLIASLMPVVAEQMDVPDAFHGTGAGSKPITKFVQGAIAEVFRFVPLNLIAKAGHRKNPEQAEAFSVCRAQLESN